MPTAATSTQPTLPRGIEIFRAGTRTAESGQTYTITQADIAAAAAAYDPALHEAPLTVGHPQSNLPAYGWVTGLQADGDVLRIASYGQVEPQFAEMVRDGRFKKRSASFYHPTDASNPKPGIWYPRHVAFLGAQPPAVKGLKDIEFSEAADAVNFSDPVESQEPTMDEETKKKLAEAEAAAAKAKVELDAALARAATAEGQVANFAEQTRKDRHAAHVSFAEGEVKAGRLLPKDQAAAVAVLDRLADGEAVEFSEGDTTKKVSPVEFVKSLISLGAPKVEFGEFKPGHAAAAAAVGSAKGKSDAEVDQAARAYAAQHKVNYSEALTAVTSFSA